MSVDLSDASDNSSQTPYELTVEDRGPYVYARVKPDFVDLQIAINYVNDVVAHLREAPHSKALLVADIPSVASPTIPALTASVLPTNKKLALVDPSPAYVRAKQVIESQRDRHPLIDAVDSVEAAERWLMAA